MQITRIETLGVRIPLKPERRMISALGRYDASEYLLVRVETDDRIDGAGEATVAPRWSGETVHGAADVVEHVLAPQLIGLDPHDVNAVNARMDAVCVNNWFAKSAIEMACWDIQGKAAGQPVYELLGGAARDLRFACRFSMGAYDIARAENLAAELVAASFRTIKVKVGGVVDDDVARVEAVRRVVGDDVAVVVDANGGWDADTAIEAVRRLAASNITLVEQPTPLGDLPGMARVRASCGIPVMADESCFDLWHAEQLIAGGCCDVISLYPGKNGGISKARAIAQFAGRHGVACSVGSNLEWDVATAAMAHFVVATAEVEVERFPGDVLGPSYHEFSIAREPITIDGPWVEVSQRPGLGVTVDWDRARQHRLSD
jgi:muconate cycloisomerase